MSVRIERIERLLNELRYEVERGMMDGEIDETIGFQWIVPISKEIPGGVVFCMFQTRPRPAHSIHPDIQITPRLTVVRN